MYQSESARQGGAWLRVSAGAGGAVRLSQRGAKFGNARTVYNGVTYHSALEASVAGVLDLLQKQGRLRYQSQAPFVLAPRRAGERAVEYVADFLVQVWPNQSLIVESRGYEPASSRLKRRWFADKYPDIPLHVVHAPEEVIAVIEEAERAARGRQESTDG